MKGSGGGIRGRIVTRTAETTGIKLCGRSRGATSSRQNRRIAEEARDCGRCSNHWEEGMLTVCDDFLTRKDTRAARKVGVNQRASLSSVPQTKAVARTDHYPRTDGRFQSWSETEWARTCLDRVRGGWNSSVDQSNKEPHVVTGGGL